MEFMLDPDVVFLNHGSFGACPRQVHDEYQRIQRRLEAQPVRFLQRELPDLLSAARVELASFIGAETDEVAFVVNPTYAVNEIARSLKLGPGDEVLTTNHEYGACRNAFQFMSERTGFDVVEAHIPLPAESADSVTELVLSAVTPQTKVLFLSQITSPTAMTFPVENVCAAARELGVITVVDGAHVPGQLPLEVKDLGPDYYVGTCHKWMCAPKGSAFFYARRDMQHLIEPLVVGWGWGDFRQFDSGSDFLDYHEWLGTDDPSAFLTVPAAIEFQRENDWPSVQSRCHGLAVEAVERATTLDGIVKTHGNKWFQQMALLELDAGHPAATTSTVEIQRQLYETHRVEVPVIPWTDHMGVDRTFVRVSVQAYNTAADIETLVQALADLGSTRK